jgi:HlyD family secretion protein
MKKAFVGVVVLVALAGGAYTFYAYRGNAPEPTVTTATLARGDIADTVGATGTLQAVTTVQVGTQVSGTILELRADFNSLVRKGQVIARLDPSLFETQTEQARANLIRAQADLERLKVTLEDARTKLARAKELSARQLIPQTELDNAEVTLRSTEAQIRSSQAQVTQADAALNQSQVNLQHTVIEAPIDGLVISRNVDVGQTVAASMSAPTLFVLAADLTKMQVVANLDESDVGRIRPGQRVAFRVDAYPAEDFSGTVAQVRLQPIVQQNVVTYATVIDVPNPELKLKPGMTANVNVEIARRTDVVRIPNAALRFRPTNEIFAALGQTPPAPGAPPGSGGAGQGSTTSRGPLPGEGSAPEPVEGPAPAATTAPGLERGARRGPDQAAESAERGGFAGRAGVDPALMQQRLQALPPEERARVLERLQARGGNRAASGAPAGRGQRGNGQPEAPRGGEPPTTIDALFGPLPPVESRGQVWLYVNNQLKPVRVRLGISDGQATELIEGDLQPGMEVVTNVSTGETQARPAPTGIGGFPPFMGQPVRVPGGGQGGGRGQGR